LELHHPAIESLALPLGLTLLLTALLHWTLGVRWGNLAGAVAIGLTLLVVHAAIFGMPVWPARTGVQKLPLIFCLLLIGGTLVDVSKLSRVTLTVTTIAAVVLLAIWLGWPQLASGDGAIVVLLSMTSLIALACLLGVVQAPAAGANRATMLVLAALGLAGASLLAGSLALFQIAMALAAALGGFALWNWPRPRLAFATSAVAVGALSCYALVLLLMLLTPIRPWVLLPLVLIFAGDALARRLPVPGRWQRTTLEPLYIVAIGLLPLLLTLLLAGTPAPPDELYYY
jgi:hypothetical protein